LPAIAAAAGWVISRAIVLILFIGPENFVQGDVQYYFGRMNELFTGTSPSQLLVEYPTPVMWLLAIPYGLGAGTQGGFVTAFIVVMMALDGGALLLLWRGARRAGVDPRPAAWFWIGFVLVMGPITYLRLDLLTAFTGVLGVLALGTTRAGAMTGVGAAIKLWPAVMWPATMTDRKQVVRSTVAFVATGGVLALVSLIWAGWGRLVSPLTWQSDRGLQIESVWATPAMIAHALWPDVYTVNYSNYQAFEVFGPIDGPLLGAASVSLIVGVLVIVGLYVLWLRRPQRALEEAGVLMIVATAIMIVTNKTFSPQYLIWLAGPIAATLALCPRGRPFARTLNWTAIWMLVLTAATQVIYPVMYNYLDGYASGPLVPVTTALLAVRNAGVVALTVWLIVTLARRFWKRPALEQ